MSEGNCHQCQLRSKAEKKYHLNKSGMLAYWSDGFRVSGVGFHNADCGLRSAYAALISDLWQSVYHPHFSNIPVFQVKRELFVLIT